MSQLWIATGNPKKRVELERLLSPLGVAVRLQSEAGQRIDVVEDRPDFAGNAYLKASALARVVRCATIADDSGLCVDALGGRPGVLSARYAGSDATDADRNERLLDELKGVDTPARSARFVCSICLVDGAGDVLATFEESCEGRIALAPSGEHGFGYDPLFIPNEIPGDTCFAELTPAAKDAISHRGKALRRLAAWLTENPLP